MKATNCESLLMKSTTRMPLWLPLVALLLAGCSGEGPPPDEAKARLPGGKSATPRQLEEAANEYYPPATVNYFADMDYAAGDKGEPPGPLHLDEQAIAGRNAWVLWAGGNQAFWDWLARHSYGAFDLLKLLDSRDRGRRFARAGLITEPDTRLPTEEETRQAFDVRYDRPDPEKHVEAKLPEGRRPRPHIYGYPSGVVGLRLFPNPEFTGEARARWNAELYYSDTAEGREYAARPDTIRPYRVGMSCGFCHIGPHPLNPPANPETPEWKNLSNNIGNQYMRFRVTFGTPLRPDNYLYHVLDAQLPGTIDTSLVPSDNLNNANTVNSFFGLPARLERAKHNPKETIGADTLNYLRTFVNADTENPHRVPRVLLDGSDSVGIELALARVYLNIGTYHQQWVRLHNPLLGFRKQQPFKLKDITENSLYWHATRIRVPYLFAFFKQATDPMLLKDAPRGKELGKLKGPGVPSDGAYAAGRAVFAKGCIACHSSIQPGDDHEIEKLIRPDKNESLPQPSSLPEDWSKLSDTQKASLAQSRQILRLRPEDLARLTRGDGTLPLRYALWARKAVEVPGFWGKKNYLSTDVRIPVALTHTNSARAMATNALHGHIWEDFASETYQELDSVGRIGYHDPFSGSEKSYQASLGGPGYYRVPTLISIWATAPFLHNNALGKFNNDPSVKGRLEAFDDAITRLLWSEKRRQPTSQFIWHADKPNTEVVDNATPDQLENDGGWVWRTYRESWLQIDGPQIPTFIAGLTGWSSFWVALVPWLPALGFVLLGLLLLLSGPLISFRERLERSLPLVEWVIEPLRWLLFALALVLGIVAVYLVFAYWPMLEILDVATQGAFPLLRLQAILIPLVLFGSMLLLWGIHKLPKGGWRMRLVHVFGALCFLVAVFLALGFGRFLSGRGSGVRLGPIPQGVPVNVLANMNPDAPTAEMKEARKALLDFVLDYRRPKGNQKPGRKEFEERVAPALLNASKCPDFVTDRGHDYEFLRNLTDNEKEDLIALLKTF